MSVEYLGSLTVGDVMPGAVAVGAAGVAGINAALPDIQARLDSLLTFSPGAVDFAAQLSLAQQTVTSIQTAISAGISPPSISQQLAQISALIAELLAAIANINAQLDLILDFQALLGSAGIHGYAFSGQTQNLGSELAAELSGGTPGGAPTDAANALVLITTVPAAWAALSQILKVTP